ncbi:cold shock domain-containing protein [Acinetobacter sp. YH12138]|uniref:cold shock domain-containing protein n=1 Tax=Acinetobacter sp. YH12138 TaxID=2601122 RepID=UPI0015D45177|nr:cold shock domain-containing protein [Acinetobacter sp. YH12138]QOW48939.1 cold shock domain-containing protein [Acinetobacter sp. YH12138]
MFKEGKIKSYNVERGFGFIQQDQAQDLFFHISDFPSRHIEPRVGENLKYRIEADRGKFKAVNIIRLDLKKEQSTHEQINPSFESRSDRVNDQATPHDTAKGTVWGSKIFSMIGLIVILVLAVAVYGKYQQYQEQKQLHLQQLMQENENIVKEQRKAQGDLPDRVLTEQGEKNLYGTASTQAQSVVQYTAQAPSSSDTPRAVEKAQFSCDGRTHCSQMKSYEEAVYFLQHCPGTKMDGNNDGIPFERQFNK